MKLFYLLLSVMTFFVGFYLAKFAYTEKSNTVNDSTIILEKIKDVFKLVFVEANYNELYTHKQYNWFDISPLRKTAIIRIQAKVTAGVNLDSAKINIDEQAKTILLRFDHHPDILYTDHSLDYYDLQQGTFNSFSSNELTTLQTKAKDLIKNKASESDLLQKASVKRDIMISTLKQLVESIGWTLIVEDSGAKQLFHN